MSHNQPRQTVVISQTLTAAANRFSVNLRNLGVRFEPSKMIVRELIYSNIAGTDMGTYLIWSSLTGQNIGAVYVGIQATPLCPHSEFSLATFTPSVEFALTPANTAYTGPTGQLTMVLEFA